MFKQSQNNHAKPPKWFFLALGVLLVSSVLSLLGSARPIESKVINVCDDSVTRYIYYKNQDGERFYRNSIRDFLANRSDFGCYERGKVVFELYR